MLAGRYRVILCLAGALGFTLPAPGLASMCPEEAEWLPAVSLASAALQESSASRRESENSAVANSVAVLVRKRACELLQQNPDLLPDTVLALETECTRVEPHLPADENQRRESLQRLIDAHAPDLLVVAWEDETDPGYHIALASNGQSALRLRWPGYGSQPTTQDINCLQSPWVF
jgi:hypothetical protein